MKQIIFLSIILLILSSFINKEEVLAQGSMNISIIPRIINGGPATITSFPYMAAVRDRNAYICVATIVGEFDFLAPARCFTHMNNVIWPYEYISIHTATSNVILTGRVYFVYYLSVHPGWTGTGNMAHDLAHIKVTPRIVNNASQRPILLPPENVRNNLRGWVTGWGVTTPEGEGVSQTMLKVKMWTMAYEQCQMFMPNQDIILGYDQLCAAQQEGFGCSKVDIGAPFVIDSRLVGIFSYHSGDSCAVAEPEVYVNIYTEQDFIFPLLHSNIPENFKK